MTEADRLAKNSFTREGEVFEYGSLAEFLTSFEFTIPVECVPLRKKRAVCIDDGIETTNPNQQIVPFSGSGIGEDVAETAIILAGVDKIKPHAGCGKATLVLEEIMRGLNLPDPTDEEIYNFTLEQTQVLGVQLGIEVGRMLGFNDGRRTQLTRPTGFHPADGAIIGLSGRFLHNLITPEQEKKTPAQFRLAGHYFLYRDLLGIAVKEALLSLRIASSGHGVGLIKRGFRFTVLVERDDPERYNLLKGCDAMWRDLEIERANLVNEVEELNEICLNVLEYSIEENGDVCQVNFREI